MNNIDINWSLFKGKDNKRSKDAYIKFFNIINNNEHKLLSEYIDSKTKVLIDFNCGHEPHWINSNNYMSGKRCPKCCGKNGQAEEDFHNMLSSNGHTLLSKYINTETKVLIDFKCGHDPYWITPERYKIGRGCIRCGGRSLEQAKEDFIKLINKNGHKLMSEYRNATTKVLIDFNCGHKPHLTTPSNYKSGYGCPKCSNLCSEQSKEEFYKLTIENNHNLLTNYINNNSKILIDFNCGHEPHWTTPRNYKNGSRCPHCMNKGESFLVELLIKMGYNVETQKKYEDLKDKYKLSYDIYIKDYNLLIELDGEHHYRPVVYTTNNMTELERDMAELDAELRFNDRQRKDKMKDDYAKKNNIPLLRIDYSDNKIDTEKWKKLILDKIEEIKTSSVTYKI